MDDMEVCSPFDERTDALLQLTSFRLVRFDEFNTRASYVRFAIAALRPLLEYTTGTLCKSIILEFPRMLDTAVELVYDLTQVLDYSLTVVLVVPTEQRAEVMARLRDLVSPEDIRESTDSSLTVGDSIHFIVRDPVESLAVPPHLAARVALIEITH